MTSAQRFALLGHADTVPSGLTCSARGAPGVWPGAAVAVDKTATARVAQHNCEIHPQFMGQTFPVSTGPAAPWPCCCEAGEYCSLMAGQGIDQALAGLHVRSNRSA